MKIRFYVHKKMKISHLLYAISYIRSLGNRLLVTCSIIDVSADHYTVRCYNCAGTNILHQAFFFLHV